MITLPPGLRRGGWSVWHGVAAVALAAAGVYATFDAWADIYRVMLKDEESSHIFLVPIVAAILVWIRRRRLRFCRPTGLWIGPVLVALGWLVHSYGDARMITAFWQGGAVLVVIGCVFSVLGLEMLKKFWPAVLVLGFLVPVPGGVRQDIAMPLQTATAVITEHTLLVLGMPIDRAGNVLAINGVDVAIAEACNGLRMVFALTLVSYAFAFSTPLRGYVRVIVIAASPLSAVLCNVVRLVPTVWLYGYAAEETADLFHDVSGWLMLFVSLLLLMGMIRALRWALVPVSRYTLIAT